MNNLKLATTTILGAGALGSFAWWICSMNGYDLSIIKPTIDHIPNAIATGAASMCGGWVGFVGGKSIKFAERVEEEILDSTRGM